VDAETLAAFIDGRLEPRERAAVEAHLAECADCYEVWMEAAHVDPVLNIRGLERRPLALGRWLVITGSVAASLLIAVWFGPRLLQRDDPVTVATNQLVSAVGDGRFTEARLSAPFAHGPKPSPVRGPASSPASPTVRQVALTLQQLALETESPATLRGAALGLLATGDVDAAIDSLSEAAQLAPERGDVQGDLSAALFERWRLRGSTADAARALDAAQRALVLVPDSLSAIFNAALAHEALSQREDAVRMWERYLKSDSTSPWAGEARTHLTRLQRESTPAATPISDRLSREVMVAWAKSGDSASGSATELAAQLASRLADSGGDRAWVDLAGRLPVVTGVERKCLSNAILAADDWWTWYNAGTYGKAADIARAISTNLRCSGSPSAEGEWREAIIDIAAGRSESAQTRAIALEHTARQHGYAAIAAVAAQIQGLVAMQRGDYDQAVALYEQALGDAGRAENEELVGTSYGYLITAHSAQGRRNLAWEDVRQCNLRLPSMPNMRRRYQCFSRSSQLAQEAGLPGLDLAIGTSLLGDPLARKFQWTASIGHLMRVRALSSLRHDDLAVAELALARQVATQIPDPVFRLESEVEVSITEGRILARTNPDLAVTRLTEALAFQQVRSNRFRTVTLLLDRGRAQALRRNPKLAEADWETGIDIFEDQSLSVRDQQLRIARTADAWDLFDELADSQRTRPAEALATVERGRARELLDSLKRDQAGAAFEPETSYDWLPRDVVVLVYATLPKRTLVWRITREDVQFAEVHRSRAELSRLIRVFLRDTRAAGPRDTLSALLLPSGLGSVSAKKIVVVPDGELHGVPFGLLRHPDSGRPLVETAVLSNSPSVAVLKALYALPYSKGKRSALLVAVGDGTGGLSRLAGVEDEIRAAQTSYTAAHSELLLNGAATSDAILRNLAHYDVFSFSGHAIADPIRPANSHLVIGGAKRELFARDLASASLRPGLIVALAACETADGDYFRGEGVMSLARPFLASGAASVLATLWPVQDQAASRLMNTFHRLVSAGTEPASALASAQREEMALGQSLDWAAFVVIGR